MTTQMFTPDIVEKYLPKGYSISEDYINKLNSLAECDTQTAELIKDNLVSYTSILTTGKYTVKEYVNAIIYCSYKIMGMTSTEAYKKTFPQRYKEWIERGVDRRDIGSRISGYNKTKLVNSILEQAYIPTWLLNQDAFQKAINTQLDLMENARSEMVRCKAADSLLARLAKPEEVKPLISITQNNNTIDNLEKVLERFVQLQKEQINKGIPVKSVIERNIINVESEF